LSEKNIAKNKRRILNMAKRFKVFKIRFPVTNKIGQLLVPHIRFVKHIRKGEQIVVESDRGLELVEFLGSSYENCPDDPVATFLRKPTYLDKQRFKRHQNIAKRLLRELGEAAIRDYGMELKPLAVYIPLDNQRIFFYYLAPHRVDFRQFIRDMSKKYKKWIEMRQLGVRDALQMRGWIGVCGNKVCCTNFMERFETINLNYISEQNLPNAPTKFTGVCGRLMCCLSFEKGNYIEKKLLPPVGSEICLLNSKSEVKVLEIDPLRRLFVYQEGETIKEINLDSILPKDFERIAKAYDCVGCECGTNIGGEFIPSEEIKDFQTFRRFF
jgi:cell fate regulator YaaT (PSP1 superfamily)